MLEFDSVIFEKLQVRLDAIYDYLHIDDAKSQIQQLESTCAEPDFWDNQESARLVLGQLNRLRSKVDTYKEAVENLEDAKAAYELAEGIDEELLQEAINLCDKCEKDLSDLELASWFEDDLDFGDAIVTITPGLGGLEAQDWCEMLFKMYLKYCSNRGWKTEIADAPVAEGIGIDRAVFKVTGENAFGMLRAEQGVHRLVRISPTDEKKRRQTTFAGVEVIPSLPQDIEVDVDPSDIRVDVYHASGPGGQGVNTTDSAVRLTHTPTGIVVTCQNERSQLQNKAMAMQILKSKLYELELEKRAVKLDEIRGPKHDISFGNQIRSYVLYPYQLVKDLRTGYETGRVESVLEDGQLDDFIIAYHRWYIKESDK